MQKKHALKKLTITQRIEMQERLQHTFKQEPKNVN
jgi:hypothetical protein